MGHSHASDASSQPGLTVPRIVLLAFLALSGIATAISLSVLWPPPASQAPVEESFSTSYSYNHEQVAGRVTSVAEGGCQPVELGQALDVPPSPAPPDPDPAPTCTSAIVEITAGPDEGRHTILSYGGLPGDPTLAEGDRIRLTMSPQADGSNFYSFADYQRTIPLWVWAAIVVGVLLVLTRWQGVRSLFALAASFAVVVYFLIPGLLHGENAMALTLAALATILFAVIPLTHGVNWKSAATLAGTLVAMGIAAPLAALAISTSHLRGLGSEDNLTAILYLPEVSILGVMLSGFIIGAVGGVTDVAVGQASTVTELAATDPKATTGGMFLSGMRVGRDHITSAMYTLVLSYTGAALPALLLVIVATMPAGQVLTGDVIATELLRSAVGVLALALAVPLTTWIAAATVRGAPQGRHSR